jgi:hypothetical protein
MLGCFAVNCSSCLAVLCSLDWKCKIWGFHGGDYEEWRILGCYAMWLLMHMHLLLIMANVPSSPILVTLMMEVLSSSETSVLTRATWRNIPEDAIRHWLKLSVSHPSTTLNSARCNVFNELLLRHSDQICIFVDIVAGYTCVYVYVMLVLSAVKEPRHNLRICIQPSMLWAVFAHTQTYMVGSWHYSIVLGLLRRLRYLTVHKKVGKNTYQVGI